MPPASDLVERLERHGQTHLLRFWDSLNGDEQRAFEAELRSIDFVLLDHLNETLVHAEPTPHSLEAIRPVEVCRLPRTEAERVAHRLATEVGESALAAGEVAVVIVAGGQGTRLGFDGPKGTYPIGPVSACSLFQIHAEKVLALGRRFGRKVPLFVMTSPENHASTARFFEMKGQFGLEHLRLFVHGRMPAVDRQTGHVLLDSEGRLALSPDGHGGTLSALAAPGPSGEPSCLQEMQDLGVRTLFYFQVDNPLVSIADPIFLGLHRKADAEVSFKIVEKLKPDERVGVVVEIDGRPQVIEYSDLPPALAELREPDGSLQLWAGSIAIHLFERSFIERIVDEARLPFHRAHKKVPTLDCSGRRIEPTSPNAVKFERFIFDALPLAQSYAVVETDRSLEFEPLKNAIGPDSPATVRQRMSDVFAGWLESAGARVVRRSDGSVPFGIEISPLFALDPNELKAKIPTGLAVEEPLYLR
jgi:UDP-N-acetylglucosamine/UDP-N-acetylgalactosamine diphosphorylase